MKQKAVILCSGETGTHISFAKLYICWLLCKCCYLKKTDSNLWWEGDFIFLLGGVKQCVMYVWTGIALFVVRCKSHKPNSVLCKHSCIHVITSWENLDLYFLKLQVKQKNMDVIACKTNNIPTMQCKCWRLYLLVMAKSIPFQLKEE